MWQRLDARPEAVLYGLLGANAAVFGLWQSGLASRAWLARHFTVSEANLRAGRWHTVVTAAFSHADVWHLLGNSFVLFFYGRELPGGRLLGLYLLGAVACSAAHVLAHSSLLRGRGEPARWWLAPPAPAALGASGAVNSLMVYSALVEPLRAVYMYGVLPVPAALLAAALLARDWVGASSGGSGTAHAGHLGGAAAGAAAWAYLRLRTRRRRVDW